MGFKSYSWCIGTTSFRVQQLNNKIETQLRLLTKLYDQEEDYRWIANKELQIKYYQMMQEEEVLRGEANIPDKDAREKTSGLVNIGVIDDNRVITQIGEEILKISDKGIYSRDNLFNIPEDSYIYLLQFLKYQESSGDFSTRPFINLLYLLIKLDYLSYDEFTYLLPICKNSEELVQMANIIMINRENINIDEIIVKKILEMDNYLEALQKLMKANIVNEKLFVEIGLNRKSGTYDKPYYKLYNSLEKLIFKNEAMSESDLIKELRGLFNNVKKISGNSKKLWKDYLFDNRNANKLDYNDIIKFYQLDIAKVKNIEEFKLTFFKMMHLFKWKVNLKEYFDLNKRYFSLTDILTFRDEKIELQMLAKYYFKDIIDELVMEDILEKDLYKNKFESYIPIEHISSRYDLTVDDLINKINLAHGTNFNYGDLINYITNLKIKEFNDIIDNSYSDDKLIELLTMIEGRDDNALFKYVTDNASPSTIFEYILGIIWYKISERRGNILEYMKLSLDANMLPKTHASGGQADIVYHYKTTYSYPEHNLLLEATLSESTGQRNMEMEPVSRHLGEQIKFSRNYNDYVVFVAPHLEERLILDFRNRRTYSYPLGHGEYIEGLKIIPISTKILKEIIIQKLKYDDIYKSFDEAYKSEISDTKWFIQDIENKFAFN
jgi:AlwI restriction endonuclease